jgi:DNA (cytosine-5)-methyltransferase 1
MNELALFAGAGGGILGGHLLGWRTVCAVEWEAYPASVLCARQNDGLLPSFPIWDDVQTFDGKPWKGIVDVVSGGFPCQDISAAGGVLESQESVAQCGNIWRESLAKLDLDTLLWKIPQCSLLEDLEQSLQTWPRWGSMRNGECFRQPMLAQTTLEKESGFWPTPMAKEGNGSMQFKLTDAVEASMEKTMPAMQKNPQKWQAFQMWPTPVCQDSRHAISRHLEPENSYWKSNLGEVVMSMETENTGRLNPMWVEWLMGWPIGWTDLKPLEMDKFHFVQQQLGNY